MENPKSISIKALWYYPVKSMQGISAQSLPVLTSGFPHDRQFMVTNEEGVFITQRQFPKMSLIRPHLSETSLSLSVEGQSPLEIDLSAEMATNHRRDVRVFDSQCKGIDLGNEASKWLTSFLDVPHSGGPLRIVCFDSNTRREVSKTHLKGEDSHTLFADGYPYLVATKATLSQLNDALIEKNASAVSMTRFRPNIVVDGTTPFDEFEWAELVHTKTGTRLGCRKPCQRCEIVTVDQELGIIPKKGQPLGALVKMNPLKAQGKKGGYFGMNATLLTAEHASLSVGDTFEVVRSPAV